MSGGSYDYAYSKVEDMATRLEDSNDPLRIAFGQHLKLVAKAMHDIEWTDSCDYSPGRDEEAIKECIQDAKAKASVISVHQIDRMIENLKQLK